MQRNLKKRVKEVVTHGDKKIHVVERIENLITGLVEELDIDTLAGQMTKDTYVQSITNFEKKLDNYGAEGRLVLFDKHDLVESISPYKSYRVVWSARYELFVSMMLRLQAGDYIKLKHVIVKHANDKIHMIPGHSLKFAWVEVSCDSVRKPILPFLVYCASQLAKKDAELLKLILSKKISAEQLLEIAAALCDYHSAVSPFNQCAVSEVLVKQMQQFLDLRQAIDLPACALLRDFIAAQANSSANKKIYTNALPKAVRDRDAEKVLWLIDHHADLVGCNELAVALEFPEIANLLAFHVLQQSINFDVPFRHDAFQRAKEFFVSNSKDLKKLHAVFDSLTDYSIFLNNIVINDSVLETIVSELNELLMNIYKIYSETGAFNHELLINLSEKTNSLVQAIKQQEHAAKYLFFKFFGSFNESSQVIAAKELKTELDRHMEGDRLAQANAPESVAKRLKQAI